MNAKKSPQDNYLANAPGSNSSWGCCCNWLTSNFLILLMLFIGATSATSGEAESWLRGVQTSINGNDE